MEDILEEKESKIVKINDDYSFSNDKYCFQLCKRYKNKQGKDSYRNVGYYGNLGEMISGLIDNEVKLQDFNELCTISANINDLKEELKRFIKNQSKGG